MRVLYLHQHFSLPTGALPGRSHAFATTLAARGHEVTIFTGFHRNADIGTDEPFRNGFRIANCTGYRVVQAKIRYENAMDISARSCAFLAYAAAATAFALSRPWDVVVATSTPLTVAIPMIAAKALRGVGCVFEVRDRWPELPRAMGGVSKVTARVLETLERFALAAADAVIALSPGGVRGCLEARADLKKIYFIPNGCDLDVICPKSIPDHILPKKQGEIVTVYFGTHGRANNLQFLLEVARIIKKLSQPIRLILIGDGSEKPYLLARVRAEGLENVSFLDPLPRTRLGPILLAADIALHCLADVDAFREGTSPNKIFEAMTAGLPIVTNCDGWLARRLVEAGAGLAVPAANPRAFAFALARLAADGEKRAQMARAARALALGEFSRSNLAQRFCDVIEGVAKGQKR